ncbi:Uncharacterized protein TCM_034941 [Theobroma cacao]|uniref:Uncharacterized protein n=1 Tax=Theobroma cacao TaxID=3641 RepID=A0A061FFC9_THECC|nr:Uncharacterized protein TCM_034941 [Theobroma cacao]
MDFSSIILYVFLLCSKEHILIEFNISSLGRQKQTRFQVKNHPQRAIGSGTGRLQNVRLENCPENDPYTLYPAAACRQLKICVNPVFKSAFHCLIIHILWYKKKKKFCGIATNGARTLLRMAKARTKSYPSCRKLEVTDAVGKL